MITFQETDFQSYLSFEKEGNVKYPGLRDYHLVQMWNSRLSLDEALFFLNGFKWWKKIQQDIQFSNAMKNPDNKQAVDAGHFDGMWHQYKHPRLNEEWDDEAKSWYYHAYNYSCFNAASRQN